MSTKFGMNGTMPIFVGFLTDEDLGDTPLVWIRTALPDMPGVNELTNADIDAVRDILKTTLMTNEYYDTLTQENMEKLPRIDFRPQQPPPSCTLQCTPALGY